MKTLRLAAVVLLVFVAPFALGSQEAPAAPPEASPSFGVGNVGGQPTAGAPDALGALFLIQRCSADPDPECGQNCWNQAISCESVPGCYGSCLTACWNTYANCSCNCPNA